MAQLQVTVVEGRNMKKKDLFSESDPFVQIYLDDKKQKQDLAELEQKNDANRIYC